MKKEMKKDVTAKGNAGERTKLHPRVRKKNTMGGKKKTGNQSNPLKPKWKEGWQSWQERQTSRNNRGKMGFGTLHN